jgi:nucleotide-binding universal stress UspA family protein
MYQMKSWRGISLFKSVLFPVTSKYTLSEIEARVSFISSLGANTYKLLHVLQNGDESKEKALKRLSHTAEILKETGNTFYAMVTEGLPAKEISRIASMENLDYIYIPGKSKNIIRRSLLGSTANDVVRLTEKPTFVHKKRPNIWKQEPLRTVIFATDFGEAAGRALPYVMELAKHIEKVVILNVGGRSADPQTEKKRLQYVDGKLEYLKEQLSTCYALVEMHARIGFPGRVIHEYSKHDTDLVVIGRFNMSPFSKVMGSTAEYVTSNVNCSILLIP